MRAVLDPNVLISAALSREGNPAQVLRAGADGHFELVLSPALLAELDRALAYPKLRRRIPAADADALVSWLGASATVLPDPDSRPAIRSEDPGDDYLLGLAGEHRLALVSGDRHLLALAGRLPVFTPRAFLELLRN